MIHGMFLLSLLFVPLTRLHTMASTTAPPTYNPPHGDHYEPQGRFSHCSALIGQKLYTYGGYFGAAVNTPSDPPTVIEAFDLTTERWEQLQTSGTPLPGFIGTTCAAIGPCLYTFAGDNRRRFFNTICQLDTRSLTWTEMIAINPQDAPMAKGAAAMVSYLGRMLVTFAGYGLFPVHRRRGVEYVANLETDNKLGWSNELCCFDLHSSEF